MRSNVSINNIKAGDVLYSKKDGYLFLVLLVDGAIVMGSHWEKDTYERKATSNDRSDCYNSITNKTWLLKNGYCVSWEPEEGENYYYIHDGGDVDCSYWDDDATDHFRRDHLGVYETAEDAHKALKELKKEEDC